MGAGLLVAGVTSYGFLVVSARAVGAERYSALSVLWALTFLVGPGVFLPLEQEVGRALSARRAHGQGGRPVLARAALAGAVMAAVLGVAVAVSADLVLEHLLGGQVLLLAGFVLALAGLLVEHLTRGALAGNGRFRPYGVVIGVDGGARFAGCAALALAGVGSAGPYGLALGLAPFLAAAAGLRRQRGLAEPGPAAPWAELSTALGWLLLASVLAQVLVNAGPLAVEVMATEQEQAAAGRFLAGLVIARIPLFLFQAVQASLIPELSGLAAAGRLREFREGLHRLLAVVAALGTLATVGCATVGPWAVALVFGEEFRLGRADLGYLAAASAAYVVGLSLAQALISLGAHARVAVGWVVGIAAFAAVVLAVDGLLLRVELAFLAGSATTAAAMAVQLQRRLAVAPAAAVAPPVALAAER